MPPKYSPTMAPMNASVVLTLRAVKRNGSMFGMRTLRSDLPVAASRRSASAPARPAAPRRRPRVTLMMIGKNTSSAAIIIFESGSSTPNQLLMMGAMAMSGIALGADGDGQQDVACRSTQRAVAKATATPGDRADDQAADRLVERGQRGTQQDRLLATPSLPRSRSAAGSTRRPVARASRPPRGRGRPRTRRWRAGIAETRPSTTVGPHGGDAAGGWCRTGDCASSDGTLGARSPVEPASAAPRCRAGSRGPAVTSSK